MSAHFPSSFDVASIIDAVRWTFATPGNLRYKVDEVPDLDWVTHVQESWLPIVTNSKFVLRFPWHSDDAGEWRLERLLYILSCSPSRANITGIPISTSYEGLSRV